MDIGFFVERIAVEDKRLIATAIQNPASGKVCKRLEGKTTFISPLLHSFVTEKMRDIPEVRRQSGVLGDGSICVGGGPSVP